MKTNKKNIKKIPIIIFTIIIFILSSRAQRIPIGSGKRGFNILFMVLHIGEFGLFSILLLLGFWPKFKLYFLVIVSMLYGYLDEVHQYFVPTRYYDIVDIVCNFIGVILGVIIYFSLVFIIKVLKAIDDEYNKKFDLMNM